MRVLGRTAAEGARGVVMRRWVPGRTRSRQGARDKRDAAGRGSAGRPLRTEMTRMSARGGAHRPQVIQPAQAGGCATAEAREGAVRLLRLLSGKGEHLRVAQFHRLQRAARPAQLIGQRSHGLQIMGRCRAGQRAGRLETWARCCGHCRQGRGFVHVVNSGARLLLP